MKIKTSISLIAIIGTLLLSPVYADDDEKTEDHKTGKHQMMQEHHALMDGVMVLMKDMIGTMKEISTDEKVKAKTDEYNKRIDEILGKHNKMKKEMMQKQEHKH